MGRQADGSIFGVTFSQAPYFRAGDSVTGAYAPGAQWQLYDPSLGCQGNGGPSQLIQFDPTNAAAVNLNGPACEDPRYSYMVNVLPQIDRQGVNARFTMRIGDNAEAYAMFNYYGVDTEESGGTPWVFGGTTTPGGPDIERVTLTTWLPVYVCGLENPTCDASNGVLNPNNPFAADGLEARVLYRMPVPREGNTYAESYRYAAGITGSFGRDGLWDYSLEAVSSKVELELVRTGYPIPRRILNAIHTGEFNFVNPSANTQTMWDYIAPSVTTDNKSTVDQIQATLARPFFELGGGSLIAAVGLAYREESVFAPSANGYKLDPYERYLSVNTVAAKGDRDVTSAFFEVDMPFTDWLFVNLAGRWDDYSTGQDNFSPKLGVQLEATDWMTLRGTYSEGFRIPSFNEAFGEPTTGYISHAIDCNASWGAAFCAAHEGTAYAQGTYSVGLTASGNPELDPEESDSFTAGVVFEPSRDMSFTIDWWRIKVENLISGADYGPALTEYYANNGVVDVPGVDGIVPAAPNPERPNALPLIGFIQYSYQNADSEIAEGIDLGANFSHAFGAVNYYTHLEVSYLMELSKTIGGTKYNYEGTLSPCDVTSCSGAPDWRATWVNTIDWNKWTFALTMNYTGSYDNASVDYGGVPGDCESNIFASVYPYDDGTPYKCTHGSYTDWDFSVSYQFSDSIQLYANILNVFDTEPEFDPASAYHLYGFNPAWELNGWRGRYFRLGVRLDF
jgi:iron complex outermembrane receptor protein